jgi:hypothetical protein
MRQNENTSLQWAVIPNDTADRILDHIMYSFSPKVFATQWGEQDWLATAAEQNASHLKAKLNMLMFSLATRDPEPQCHHHS